MCGSLSIRPGPIHSSRSSCHANPNASFFVSTKQDLPAGYSLFELNFGSRLPLVIRRSQTGDLEDRIGPERALFPWSYRTENVSFDSFVFTIEKPAPSSAVLLNRSIVTRCTTRPHRLKEHMAQTYTGITASSHHPVACKGSTSYDIIIARAHIQLLHRGLGS